MIRVIGIGAAASLMVSCDMGPGGFGPGFGGPIGGPGPVIGPGPMVGAGPGWGWGDPGWGGGWGAPGWGGPGWGRGGWGRPGWGGAGWNRGGWNRGGWNAACCQRCGRNPCACGHRHTASANIRPEDRRYRIIAGDLGGKRRPNDFHSLQWFHDRGYSLQNVKVETENGTVIDRRPSSQRSSASSSRSSNSSRSNASSSRSSGSSSSKSKSSNSSSSRTTASRSGSSSSKPSGGLVARTAAAKGLGKK